MATDALVSVVVEDLYSITKDGWSSLFGVKKEVDELSSTFSDIQAVLEDAESHQVTNERVRGWLWELKEVAYEVKDILDEWVTDALLLQEDKDKDETHHPKWMRFSFSSAYQSYKQVKLQYDIGKKIRETTKRLGEISIKKNRFNLRELNTREVMLVPNKEERQTGSLIDESEIFGRDDFKEGIIEQLLSEEKSVSIVSIVGMGGLGKTTLAQLIYNDGRVMARFKKNRIWVCVSVPFDAKRIAIKVIDTMGKSTSNNPDLDSWQHSLRKAIDKKRFLLVLDDVWDETGTQWEILRVPLTSAAPGSKILVTTRSGEVGKAMKTHHIHDLGVLSDPDCWKLFKSIAFEGAEDEDSQELIATGERILKRCKGVPLAVKALGSLLRSRREKWYWEHVLESEIWEWDIAKDDGILPALLLSYYNLPPYLKRCFSFCSVFPKDHVIEKDELVKLWMAHGIIKSKKAKKDVTEETGGMYFDNLLTRSLFQDAEKDINGNVVGCKMHDLVHDLATFVGSGDYCSMEAGDSELCSIKCHHLSLLVNEDVSSIPSLPCNVERLHTLLLFGYSYIEAVPDTLFNPLRYLRALDLSGTSIENLPSFIGKLKHLRYLKLDGRGIRELPESITNLCNLQTLKLNYCTDLQTLPSGISKMVKLWHLEIEGTNNLTVLPNGLGRLTSLRTLCKFPVGDENGGCKIGELKDLNLLRELSIENLERVMNVNDASEAELHKKSDLHVLSLCCNDKSNEEWRTVGDDEMKRMDSILEGLRPPHSNLKELKIKNYAGSMFPNWLEDSKLSSLVEVVLENCMKCKLLSGLGKLPSLKYLKIIGADEVKVVGSEFYGTVDAGAKETRFPKLEELHFESMLNWEEWKLTQEYGEVMPSLKKLEIIDCRKVMLLPGLGKLPSLKYLKIIGADAVKVVGCEFYGTVDAGAKETRFPKLEELHFESMLNWKEWKLTQEYGEVMPSLKKLEIIDCRKVMLLPGLGKLPSLKYLKIIRADAIEVVGCEFYGTVDAGAKETRFPKLEELHFESMVNWEEWKLTQEYGEVMPSLKKLEIIDCRKVKATLNWLPSTLREVTIQNCYEVIWAPDNPLPHLPHLNLTNVRGMSSKPLPYLPALKALKIMGFSCESLPSDGWGLLESLHTLHIYFCNELASLPDGLGQLNALQTMKILDCKRLSSLPEGVEQLKALQTLQIWNCERLSSLPEGVGRLKALQTLFISNCKRLSFLPEGLGQLKALQRLYIWNCEQLRPLPNLQHLTALEDLMISNCPFVTERLEKERGEDWCKISHIPFIRIDGRVIQEGLKEMKIRSATSSPSLGNLFF